MNLLPREVDHVGVPPIKCQGIKTKLVQFILGNISWAANSTGRWIEPFIGSGVVVFNLAPERAILADTNKHIITLYQSIQAGELTPAKVRGYLLHEGNLLEQHGADHYYAVRDRFNAHGSPLDFLFLNRSCFNGVMRFNRRGQFNVPFGHKPQRFAQAYITKITNQVAWVARQMHGKQWEFHSASWDEILPLAESSDFVYLDPPYIGRHADYYNSWDDDQATKLAEVTKSLPCGFALSMWMENKYRRNTHIDECWQDMELRLFRHFYHVGSSEDYRAEMDEALIVKPGFLLPELMKQHQQRSRPTQIALPI